MNGSVGLPQRHSGIAGLPFREDVPWLGCRVRGSTSRASRPWDISMGFADSMCPPSGAGTSITITLRIDFGFALTDEGKKAAGVIVCEGVRTARIRG